MMSRVLLPVLLCVFAVLTGAESAEVQNTANVACAIVYNANYPRDLRDLQDHVATLKQHAALLNKHGLKGGYWFTWLAADMVCKADPGLIPSLVAAGHGVHHHGANRPPEPTPIQRCKGKDFWADVIAVLDYETHDIDAKTGELIRSRVGGMLGLQQKYGLHALCDGRMVKAPVFAVERAFGVRMGVGFGDNSGLPMNQGWFMGLLGRPEAAWMHPSDFEDWVLRSGTDPRIALERYIRSVPSNTFGMIALLMHDWDWFRGLTPSERTKIWTAYEQVLVWAKNHRRLRIHTMAQLWSRVRDERRPQITPAALDGFAAALLAQTGSEPGYPLTVNGESLSLADLYVMLVEAVILHRIKPGRPWSDTVSWEILGPLAQAGGLTNRITITPTQLEDAALESAATILTSGMLAIPETTRVGTRTVNATELLFAMARFYRQIHATGRAASVQVGPHALFPALHPGKRIADPLTRLQHWTWKPARFD